jgi:hypothetical protein
LFLITILGEQRGINPSRPRFNAMMVGDPELFNIHHRTNILLLLHPAVIRHTPVKPKPGLMVTILKSPMLDSLLCMDYPLDQAHFQHQLDLATLALVRMNLLVGRKLLNCFLLQVGIIVANLVPSGYYR